MKQAIDPIRSARPLVIHLLALATLFVTFPLLLSGGLVVSTESSLAVPDWPTSFGGWMPAMEGGVFFEHGHRLIGATVGFLMLTTTLWALFTEPRSWVRRLAIAGLAAVVTQGLLGGLTVLNLLPMTLSVSHACLAQVFFCLMLAMSILTSPWWNPELVQDQNEDRGLSTGSRIMMGMLLVQLFLGAMVRMHRPDLSVPLIVLHVVWALAVVVAGSWLGVTLLTSASGRISSRLLGLGLIGLVIPQLFLGFAAYLARQYALRATAPSLARILFPTAHHFTGAMILGLSLVIAILYHRRSVADAGAAPAEAM